MAKWGNPLAEVKPMTVGVFLFTLMWVAFQWRDPTPPPVLDQILVAVFGAWFANEALDKHGIRGKRSVKIGKDGTVSVANPSDDDEDDDEGTPTIERSGSG